MSDTLLKAYQHLDKSKAGFGFAKESLLNNHIQPTVVLPKKAAYPFPTFADSVVSMLYTTNVSCYRLPD